MDGGFKPATEHTIQSGGGFVPNNPSPIAPSSIDETEEPKEDE